MKGFKRIITIVLAMCLASSLFLISACKEEVEKDTYYTYSSAQIQADLKVNDNYEYKDIAQTRETFLNADLLDLSQDMNEFYAQDIVKLTSKKLVWYMENGFEEYTISVKTENKRIISEIDAETFNNINSVITACGATIQQMEFYLLTQGSNLKLHAKIGVLQTVIDYEKVSAEYNFEYTFTATSTRPETEGDTNASAVYRYQNLALDISIEESGSTTLPTDTKEQLVLNAKNAMSSALASYNTSYVGVKLSIFEDKIVWHNAGIKTTYGVEEKAHVSELNGEIEKGVVKTLKELINLYGKVGSYFSFDEIDGYYTTSGNNCQLVIEIEGTATALNGQVAVPIDVLYQYTINLTK